MLAYRGDDTGYCGDDTGCCGRHGDGTTTTSRRSAEWDAVDGLAAGFHSISTIERAQFLDAPVLSLFYLMMQSGMPWMVWLLVFYL